MRLFACPFALLVLSVGIASIHAQDRTPTADSAKALKSIFQEERSKAASHKFPPQTLELSDQLVKRADAALEGGSFREAARLYREARWQLPYLSPDLPKDVTNVFGNTRMRHGDWVNQIAYNPDGSKLVSGSRDGTVKIWDMGNGREIRTYRGHKDPVRSVAWSADGKLIASAGGNDIHIWTADDGKLVHTLKGHTAAVNSVSIREDSKALVSGSDDRSIRVWDLDKGKELSIVNQGQIVAVIYFVTYSSNGKLIASVNGDGQLHVWKPDMPPPQQKLVLGSNAHPGGSYQVAFSTDMKMIFTCGGDKMARQHGGTDPEGQTIAGTGVRQKNFDVAGGGHSETVTSLAISPDGKTFVTGSRDRSIRVWDLNTTKVIRTLQGHTDEVTSLAFTKDGTQLASASKDQNIRVWNLSSADEHRNFPGHEGYVWSAIFSPDGKLMASAGADRTIVIRNVITGEILKKIAAHSLAVTALAFNQDGTQLASSGGDQLVKLWNVKTGELIKEFKGHTSAVMAVAFSNDGKQLLSGGADKIARLWDVEKGTTIHTFPDSRSPISSVAIRKDAKQALLGCADGTLQVFNLTAAPKETGFVGAHLSGVGAVAYSPDGQKIATCGGDKLVKIWRAAEAGAPTLISDLKGHANPVSSVAFSNDGRLLASGGGDLIVKVWDVQNGTELRSLRGHGDWVSSVAFGVDSRFVLSASVDKTVKIWELSNEETVPPIGHTRRLNTLAVSADGKLLASGSDDRTIKIWDMQTGQELYTLSEHTGEITALAFDPKGERLISGGEDRKIRVWDLKARKSVQVIDCDRVPVIVFTLKGDKFLAWFFRPGIANQSASTAQVYDTAGKPLYALTEREKPINCLAFSSDGEWVAMGSTDGSVRIWDIAKNERPLGGDMPVHQKGLGDLVFTPDKKTLITGDEEGEIKIWNLAKKEAVKTFVAHKGGLLAISMSPDGKRFVTVGQNGEMRLWSVDKGEKLKEWELPTPVRNLIFTPDGKKIVTANGDTTLYQIELPD
ncbi:MAG: WD40 repeat domain-containing protein [Planctomycetes bacterium]|nr:WD40 repeat domain-containing protein [Planctomycetota bacterium]